MELRLQAAHKIQRESERSSVVEIDDPVRALNTRAAPMIQKSRDKRARAIVPGSRNIRNCLGEDRRKHSAAISHSTRAF